jgi:hypothetical protein
MKISTKQKRTALLGGLITALLNAAFFIVGIGLLLGNPLQLQNILAIGIFSLIIGALVFLFLLFRLMYAFGVFITGFLAGSVLMLSTFGKGVAGWEDLVGLLTYLFFLGLGLIAGLVLELIVYLVKRSRKDSHENLQN